MLHDPQTAFGLIAVQRFSTLQPERLEAPPSTASLTSPDGTVRSAIVHARSRYRAFCSGVRQLMPAGHRLGGAGAAKARKSCRSRPRRLYRWAQFRETCKSHGRSQTGDGQTPVGQRGARLKKSNLRSRPDAS
jgi:hypothetical protein